MTPIMGNGKKTFAIRQGDTTTITNFGRVGAGVNPSAAVLAEVDTLKFEGAGLTAENMRLTQQEQDLLITFSVGDFTQVTLKNFDLEDLENLQTSTGASVDIGNILFDGQTLIQDSFDVINANCHPSQVFNPNTVTFLNNLDNETQGLDNSNDLIYGRGGNNVLRGGTGDARLYGKAGNNVLCGDGGNHTLTFSRLDLLNLSDTTNQLTVKGNPGDAVSSTGQGWSFAGTTALGDTSYNRYTAGAATLLVGTTLSQTLT